jgi:hypothetical protein
MMIPAVRLRRSFALQQSLEIFRIMLKIRELRTVWGISVANE